MRIEHIALWTHNLEELKNFYVRYFDAIPNNKYINKKKGFESYFLTFKSGPRLEIMTLHENLHERIKSQRTGKRVGEIIGIAHFAFALDSREEVDALAKHLLEDGYTIVSKPRVTGDGYYECSVLDPDGNTLEITKCD
jgi:lactoylglutathione lyase